MLLMYIRHCFQSAPELSETQLADEQERRMTAVCSAQSILQLQAADANCTQYDELFELYAAGDLTLPELNLRLLNSLQAAAATPLQ